jgi:hypothetical protein
MPRASDVDTYRDLIAAQQPGLPAPSGRPGPAAVRPATSSGPLAMTATELTAVAIRAADRRMFASEAPLVATVEGHSVVVLGDLDQACVGQGLAGYARLLVRAGAVAEAGRAAATAAGRSARVDDAVVRTPGIGDRLVRLCAVELTTGTADE